MVRVAFVYLSILTVFLATVPVECGKEDAANKKTKEGEEWKKKDVRDYSDADIERLYDQWEVCVLEHPITDKHTMYTVDLYCYRRFY